MESPTITMELPVPLYTSLQALARQERIDLPELLTRLLQTAYQETATTRQPAAPPQSDPVLALIGAYRSDQPLIDDIPASEDPDLYMTATSDELRAGKHAWDIAPARYTQGADGQPVRIAIADESRR